MKTYSLEYLMSQVNKTIMAPSPESIRIGVMTGVRQVFRKIGIHLVCGFNPDEEIQITENKFRIPDRVISIENVFDSPHQWEHYQAYHTLGTRSRDHDGYKVNAGLYTGKRLAYRESPLELYFPNLRQGTAYMACHYLYEDQDGEIMIPEIVYMACLQYCSYLLLDMSNNPRNPKWQERLIMKQNADQAILEARGDINQTKTSDHKTARFLR